jgi:acylphosphatase
MRQRARQLGINGWVRNRRDGTVEAMVQGQPEAVAAIIEWAGHGPDTAQVTDVQIEEALGNFDTFDLLPTF